MHPTVRPPRRGRAWLAVCIAIACLAAGPAGADNGAQAVEGGIDARMLADPDISAEHLAFVYAGDIWIAPATGGTAHRLTSAIGEERAPRFSPDGRLLAFTANYDGNDDVYVMPVAGGQPHRVTWHPAPDTVVDWTPDGGELIFASRRMGNGRVNELWRIPAQGGHATQLPVPYGDVGVYSDSGVLAWLPWSRESRTWKRYRGGMAPDLWLYDAAAGESARVSPSDANESSPMWHGETLYFLSDRNEAKRANVYRYDAASDEAVAVTRFETLDIHTPAIGPDAIVFVLGGELMRLPLGPAGAGEPARVEVRVVTDDTHRRPRLRNVSGMIRNVAISPAGGRAVVEARGELFTVPAEHGIVRAVTRSSGANDRTPVWSPDGESIAYVSDETGEYQLYLRAADGSDEPQKLTDLGPGFRYQPQFSPDSRRLAFIDQSMTMWLLDRGPADERFETPTLTELDRGLWMYQGSLMRHRFAFSRDSRWIAWSRGLPNRHSAVFLYDTESGERLQVTDGLLNAYAPAFDPTGKYLYWLTDVIGRPTYGSIIGAWNYVKTTRIACATLRRHVPSPLAARNDTDESVQGRDDDEDDDDDGEPRRRGGDGDGDENQDNEGGDEPDDQPARAVHIHIDGLADRMILLPIAGGNLYNLRATRNRILFIDGGALKAWNLKKRKQETILDKADRFEVSANGQKLLVQRGKDYAIVNVRPNADFDPLALDRLHATVDPVAEWRQLFVEAWRLQRDFFYDPGMHGTDWQAMRERYEPLLEHCASRSDVNRVIGELIGEINASHTYRGGGDAPTGPKRGVGMLGVDWAPVDGAWQITAIVPRSPWDPDVRSPLHEPGVDVSAGDFVLAVNGRPLDVAREPYAAFEGLAGETVALLINDSPAREGAREVLVELPGSESMLRYTAWVESRRRHVEQVSNGRIGYIYVPDTGRGGQTELVQQFRAQFDRAALIVDERWNGGGQIPDRFVELLDRPPLNYWAVRDGADWQWPYLAHSGPKCMLINGRAGSGGDAFPFYFREAGLGPLIGTRTWGGLIGITGAPRLIDGGRVTVPTFGIYSREGEWIIENEGVSPDIEVLDDPLQLADGGDPVLDRAIAEMLAALETVPQQPQAPPYPDRSGR